MSHLDSHPEAPTECGPVTFAFKDIESNGAKPDNPKDCCPSLTSACASPLFPIQRFPIDVLISIFLAAVDNALQDGTLTMSRTHPAVVASHVCHEWREIALTTAALWSRIHLILPPYPWCLFEIWGVRAESFTGMNQKQAEDFWKNGLQYLEAVTEVWLSRSKDCLLSVDIGEVDEPHIVTEEGWPEEEMADGLVHLDKIIDLLCDASPRWRDFSMSCTITPHTRRLLLVPAQTTPVLRSARAAFGVWSWEGWEMNFLSSTRFLTVESLHSLDIPSLTWQDILTIPVKWSSLTNLTFGGYRNVQPISGTSLPEFTASFGGHQALELLSKCPNLQRVELHVVNKQTNWSLEPVSLPFLEEIIVRPTTSPYSLPIGFAPSLMLPSLHKYTMADGESAFDRVIPSAHNGLVECIHQYSSTLTDITFCYMVLTPSALRDCLQQLPNILRLNLRGLQHSIKNRTQPEQASLSQEILAMLTPQFGESGLNNPVICLCPGLQEFGCRPNQGMLSEFAFVDFVAGRRMKVGTGAQSVQVARLKRVFVDCTGPSYRDPYRFEIDVAQELDRRGVDMEDFAFDLLF